MAPGYIELENLDHLRIQARGGGVFGERLWRESYYFHMTDPKPGISLVTTIGLLPNRKRSTGFVLLLRDGRVVLFRLLAEFRRPVSHWYGFQLRGLEYAVESIGWRLRFRSGRCAMDLRFDPVNRIYPYINGGRGGAFSRLGSQHYEQSGTFAGRIRLDGETIAVGSGFGHRDHSWGIRDWSAVGWYRLFHCTFSKEFAINLWEGRIGSSHFIKGYVFDGTDNRAVVACRVSTLYEKDGRTPRRAALTLRDEAGREYELRCRVLYCAPFPLNGCVLYETVSRMECDGRVSTGLLEYLFHEERLLPRIKAYIKFMGMLRGRVHASR